MSALAVLDPRAAFVDVGSEKMHVSIGGGPPRVFGTVTSQLQALRDFLVEHQVRSVAMEATGVSGCRSTASWKPPAWAAHDGTIDAL